MFDSTMTADDYPPALTAEQLADVYAAFTACRNDGHPEGWVQTAEEGYDDDDDYTGRIVRALQEDAWNAQTTPFESPSWTAPAEVSDPEPSPVDTRERIALADLIRAQITKYRSWENEAGDLFASHMLELLSEVIFLKADTAAEFHDHRAILLVD